MVSITLKKPTKLELSLLALSINNLKIGIRLNSNTARKFAEENKIDKILVSIKRYQPIYEYYYVNRIGGSNKTEKIYLFSTDGNSPLYNSPVEKCHCCKKKLYDKGDLSPTDSPTLRALKLKSAGNKVVNWSAHTGVNRYNHFCSDKCRRKIEKNIVKKGWMLRKNL